MSGGRRRPGKRRGTRSRPTTVQVPGWGCALGLILLTVLLLLASGACSSLFDPEDDLPGPTTEPASAEQ